MGKKVALITGITGQDGSYLAELLLEKGYHVHGIKRRSSLINTNRIDHIYQDIHVKGSRFILHHGDMTDGSSLLNIIKKTEPDEIYNLAAQSHVAVSFEQPEYTANSDALGLCVFWRPFVVWVGKRKHDFTRLAPVNYMVRSRKPLKPKTHPSTQEVHTEWQSSTLIG